MNSIIEVYGPANSPYTNALRMLAPDAALTIRDDIIAVILADGRHISPFESILELVGADPKLVSLALSHDLKRLDQHLQSRTFLIGSVNLSIHLVHFV